MFSGKDIISGQMAHDMSLTETIVARRSLLKIQRDPIASVLDESYIAQKAVKERSNALSKMYSHFLWDSLLENIIEIHRVRGVNNFLYLHPKGCIAYN